MTSIKNAESSFTELFNLLKRYDCISEKSSALAYSTSELNAILGHVGNATIILLQGMQEMGNVIGLVSSRNKNAQAGLSMLCFFIAMISNLTEALFVLHADTHYVLSNRG